MLTGIIVAVLIPVLAGLALWFTDWAESVVVAPVPPTPSARQVAAAAGD